MSFRWLFALLSMWGMVTGGAVAYGQDALRVCSDPNNLPYSNREEKGFENRIAELIAADLGLDLEYTWFPQRMGFIRNTLKFWDDEKGRFRCDLVIGVPKGFDISDTTSSYYRSTYVIVVREKGVLSKIHTEADFSRLSEDQLATLRVGAFAPSPSVNWLERHGLSHNTRYYQVMSGDPDYYPGKILEEELIPGNLDAVLIWGPIAGYFASQNPEAGLRIIPLQSGPGMRFDYAMAMGVRRGEKEWKARIEESMSHKREEILAILHQYQVPLIEGQGTPLPVDDDD